MIHDAAPSSPDVIDASDAAIRALPPAVDGPPGGLGGIARDLLGAVGVGFDALTELEQKLTAPLAAIPFPALPALRVTDAEIGLPHGHFHPPNLIPPFIPVPLPLPSIGMIVPIPFFSGAETVSINGLAAARTGDMGVAVWCGSFFPLFEIFLGSAKVWVEGSRAGRVGVDITTHCIFAAPKPQDPPCYPWIGFPITGSGDVLIGGVPLPSLVDFALGKAFELLFSGVFGVARRAAREIRARRLVNEFMDQVDIVDNAVPRLRGRGGDHFKPESPKDLAGFPTVRGGDGAPQGFETMVRRDLLKIARTEVGNRMLSRMQKSGVPIEIGFTRSIDDFVNHPLPESVPTRRASYTPGDPNPNVWIDGLPSRLEAKGLPPAGKRIAAAPGSRHKPQGSRSLYNPGAGVKETPSDVMLFHELAHGYNKATGNTMPGAVASPSVAGASHGDVAFLEKYRNFEEYNAVLFENHYRTARNLPLRPDYDTIPGL